MAQRLEDALLALRGAEAEQVVRGAVGHEADQGAALVAVVRVVVGLVRELVGAERGAGQALLAPEGRLVHGVHLDDEAHRDVLVHLVLPSVVLGWTVAGTISRLVRANMLEVMEREFILTARAKGAGEMRVVLRHAFRNILVPVLTVISYSFAYLITGAVLTETVFAWPGMGSYAVTAARSLDFPAIIGVTIVGGVMFLITNLLTDIAYVLANPRVRLN